MKRIWKELTSMKALLLAVLLASAAPLMAQVGPLDRSNGWIVETGEHLEFTAGAATIAARDIVYLTTAGTVLKVPTTGQTTTIIGVAPAACAANQTACVVQVTGIATVVADDTVAVGDYIGAPTGTAGRGLTLGGTIDINTVAGKALTVAAAAGDTFTMLLLPGKGATALANGTSGGVPFYTGTNTVDSSALLGSNNIVLGGGAGTAPKTAAGLSSDGTSQLRVGVAGTSVGSVQLANATSGSITIQPTTGALGTVTYTGPAASQTLGHITATIILGAAATHVDTMFFIADRQYIVTDIDAVWGTAEATGDMDVMLERLQGTEACDGGSGDNLLSAAIDASSNGGGGTANTVNNGTLAGGGVTTLAAGNRLCLNLTATPNEITNLVVTVGLDPA